MRVQFSTKLDPKLKDALIKLSETTRIPQTRLLDEAIEDLLKKHSSSN